jgi:hypothetical protein
VSYRFKVGGNAASTRGTCSCCGQYRLDGRRSGPRNTEIGDVTLGQKWVVSTSGQGRVKHRSDQATVCRLLRRCPEDEGGQLESDGEWGKRRLLMLVECLVHMRSTVSF